MEGPNRAPRRTKVLLTLARMARALAMRMFARGSRAPDVSLKPNVSSPSVAESATQETQLDLETRRLYEEIEYKISQAYQILSNENPQTATETIINTNVKLISELKPTIKNMIKSGKYYEEEILGILDRVKSRIGTAGMGLSLLLDHGLEALEQGIFMMVNLSKFDINKTSDNANFEAITRNYHESSDKQEYLAKLVESIAIIMKTQILQMSLGEEVDAVAIGQYSLELTEMFAIILSDEETNTTLTDYFEYFKDTRGMNTEQILRATQLLIDTEISALLTLNPSADLWDIILSLRTDQFLNIYNFNPKPPQEILDIYGAD